MPYNAKSVQKVKKDTYYTCSGCEVIDMRAHSSMQLMFL